MLYRHQATINIIFNTKFSIKIVLKSITNILNNFETLLDVLEKLTLLHNTMYNIIFIPFDH